MKNLIYNKPDDKRNFLLNSEEYENLCAILTEEHRPTHITFRGNVLKTALMEILDTEFEQPQQNKFRENLERQDEIDRKWTEEQVRLSKQSVEQKVEREWTHRFMTVHLLAEGYSNLLGKDWKEKLAGKDENGNPRHKERIKKFNLTVSPKLFIDFSEIVGKFFTKNSDCAWCPQKIYHHLSPNCRGTIYERSLARILS